MRGEKQNDFLFGGANNDTLYGDEGDDFLRGEQGNDSIFGGAGTDTAAYENNWQYYRILSGRSLSDFRLQLTQFEGGTDRIAEVERLQFANRTFNSISEFFQAHDARLTTTEEPNSLPAADPTPTPPTGSSTPVATPLLYVNNSRASVIEGDSGTRTAQFEINLSAPTDHAVTFIWVANGGNGNGLATNNVDFKFASGQVTIPAGEVTAFVPVTVYGDNDVEDTESFSFIVSNLTGAELAGGGLIRIEKGWIIDDDAASAPPPPPPVPDPTGPVNLTIDTNDPSEYEGSDGNFVEFDFLVRRAGDLGQRTDYRIELQGYGGTPLTADDFYDGQFPVELGSFGPGEDRDRFTVRIRSDSIQEADEYFRAKLTTPEANATVSTKYAYAAVLNDDGRTLPSAGGEVYLRVRALQPEVVEGTSDTQRTPVQFEITRTGDLNQITHFRYSFDTSYRSGESPDIITNSADGVSGSFSPNFDINQSSYVVTRYLNADDYNEPNEYLTIRLRTDRDSPNAVILNETASTLVINDDGPLPPRITSRVGVVEETDEISTAYVRVDLEFATSVDVSMDYTIDGGFAGSDYVARTGVLTIPSGRTYGEIAVQIVGDNIAEPLEYVEIELENPVNGYFGHSNIDTWDTGLVIVDDDQVGGFSLDATALAENAINLGSIDKYDLINHHFILGTPEDILVYRLEATDTMTIDTDSPSPALLFNGDGQLIHSNFGNFDYLRGSETSGIADSHVFTPGEYYLVYSGAANLVGIPHQTEFRGMPTLSDVPLATLHFSTSGSESRYTGDMTEGGADWYRYAVVELSHAVDYEIIFDIAVNHITTSTDDFGYVTHETITIAPGDWFGLFRLTATNDAVFEGDDTFAVTVSNVSGALLPGGATSFSRNGVIHDNEENPNQEFEIRAISLDRAEGSNGLSIFTFVITRPDAFSDVGASVDWAVLGNGFAPVSSSDFEGGVIPSGRAEFAIGQSEIALELRVVGDRFSESDETFEIMLANPSEGSGLHNSSVSGVIRNDDGISQSPIFGDGTVITGVSYVMNDDDVDAILVGGAPAFITGNQLPNSISGNNANNELYGNGGDDKIFGRDGHDVLDGGNGSDSLVGEGGDDTLKGHGGNDTLIGGAGDDRIEGGDGNELIEANEGNDTVFGGNGTDIAFLGSGHDRFTDNSQSGANGADTVFGNAGNDTIIGGGGDDDFRGQNGNDSITGGTGNDLLHGGSGYDTIRGGTGDDTVIGGNGRDLVYLGGGNDLFIDNAQGGVNGRDTIYANAGNDTLGGGAGDDVFNGQDGHDRLIGRLGNDRLFGGNQNDTMEGGDGNDTIAGGNGRDRAYMGNGNDIWWDNGQVQFGDDYVVGGDGNDLFHVGAGNDTMSGGEGADTFEFAQLINDDIITDYEVGVDVLQFAATLWNGALDQARLDALAAPVGSDLVFTFYNGDSLTLTGITTTVGLLDDISLI